MAVLIGVETIHGILRTLFLAPRAGDFEARQIGVFIGSFLILAIACIFVPWIHADSTRPLPGVGLLWLVLTLLFELRIGHFVFKRSWELLAADYKIWQGGLLRDRAPGAPLFLP